MPHETARALPLDLFHGDTQASRDALARDETLRPILTQERTLAQHSRITGLSDWRLWRDLRRVRRAGVIGLLDRRTLPHPRGKPATETHLPQSVQPHIVRLALAHPCTARELARMVRECSHQPIDDRGIQRVLARHRLSPAALQRHHQMALQASLPKFPSWKRKQAASQTGDRMRGADRSCGSAGTCVLRARRSALAGAG